MEYNSSTGLWGNDSQSQTPTVAPLIVQQELTLIQLHESLAHMKFVDTLEIPDAPTTDFVEATHQSYARSTGFALINLQNIIGSSFSEAATNSLKVAAIYAGTAALELAPQLITDIGASKQRIAAKEILIQHGFITEGETVSDAQKRHLNNLVYGLDHQMFVPHSKEKLDAITKVSQAYMSGKLDLIGNPDLNLPRSQQTQVYVPMFDFKKVDALLNVCKQEFAGLDSLDQLSNEQGRSLSWVRSAMDSQLLHQLSNYQVQDYIRKVYIPELESIHPDIAKDFTSRLQMIEQINQMETSNIPMSRREKIFQKVAGILFPMPKEPEIPESVRGSGASGQPGQSVDRPAFSNPGIITPPIETSTLADSTPEPNVVAPPPPPSPPSIGSMGL